MNVSDLLRGRASERPDDVAVTEAFGDRRQITWGQLDAQADSVSRSLSARGLVAGHRVGLVFGNQIEFVVTYLGIQRGGLVAVPMNPRSAAGELVRMIADSGSRVVFCGDETAPGVREAVASVEDVLAHADEQLRARSVVPHVVVAGTSVTPGETAYDDVLTAGASGRAPVSPSDPETLSTLLYTSGTSGQPRGVMLTHRALLANIEQVAAIDPPAMGPDDVVLGLLPLFHIYGLNCVLGQVVRQGARLVLVEHFDPDETLRTVRELGVTNIPIAPPVVAVWAGRSDLRDAFAAVRTVLCGASALEPDLAELFTQSSGVVVEQGYGLTETAPVLTATLASGNRRDGLPKPGSVGGALDGIDIKIIDSGGQDAAVDDPGEIVVRGPNLFSGYWPDGADGPDADGWYATGDVGVIDTEGDLLLVDRLRELVIVSGFNVYPREVEDVIVELPDVIEAAVIGVPDAQTGEAVHAFVVAARADRRPEELASAIAAHCETRLARFKWPRHIEVVGGLPHSATGKVAKGRLRAQYGRDTLGLG